MSQRKTSVEVGQLSPPSSDHEGPVGVYRFYNYTVSEYGTPFSLCAACVKLQRIPDNCELRKLAHKSVRSCEGIG
jgi:hypothetical protein